MTPLCDLIFVIFFLKKNVQFNAIWITFRTFLELFQRTKLLMFETSSKINLPSFRYLEQVKFKTYLNACILGLNFLSNVAKGEGED